MTKKTEPSTVVSFAEHFARRHPDRESSSLPPGGGEGDASAGEYLYPTIHAFIALQYLEITGRFPGTMKELSLLIRNVVIAQGKLSPYVIISQKAFDDLGETKMWDMQMAVMEAAKKQIAEICGETHHV